jgi:hypothetical protein
MRRAAWQGGLLSFVGVTRLAPPLSRRASVEQRLDMLSLHADTSAGGPNVRQSAGGDPTEDGLARYPENIGYFRHCEDAWHV